VTYADLKAKALQNPAMNETEWSVARMKDVAKPMPPGALPSAGDVAILENWIKAGYPMGSCGGDAGPPVAPPPPPSVFKGAMAFAPRTGGSSHKAGEECMHCHKSGGGDAPAFSFGGTLYDPTGKPVGGAEVRLVDAKGVATSVYSGANGTFWLNGNGFAMPAQIGVRNATVVQDMYTPLTAANNGAACSSCHCIGAGCSVSKVHLP
jgi:hypothetical protein